MGTLNTIYLVLCLSVTGWFGTAAYNGWKTAPLAHPAAGRPSAAGYHYGGVPPYYGGGSYGGSRSYGGGSRSSGGSWGGGK